MYQDFDCSSTRTQEVGAQRLRRTGPADTGRVPGASLDMSHELLVKTCQRAYIPELNEHSREIHSLDSVAKLISGTTRCHLLEEPTLIHAADA